MYHESIGCRLALAFVQKMRGQLSEAITSLSQLSEELRWSSKHSYVAVSDGNLAELLFHVGRSAEARTALTAAFDAAELSHDPLVVANVFMLAGGVYEGQGEHTLAVRAFRTAIGYLDGIGEGSTEVNAHSITAYVRVVVAESLLALGLVEDARRELAHALPTIRERGMVLEGIHALKLLGSIAETSPTRDLRDRAGDGRSPFGA